MHVALDHLGRFAAHVREYVQAVWDLPSRPTGRASRSTCPGAGTHIRINLEFSPIASMSAGHRSFPTSNDTGSKSRAAAWYFITRSLALPYHDASWTRSVRGP